MTDRRRITRPATILLVALGIYLWSRAHPREIVPFRHNYAAALDESRRTGKPLFLDFSATWCGPCQEMKSTTWADPRVAAELSAYIPVELDVDDAANAPMIDKYHADAIPLLVVLDANGNLVHIAAQYLSAGEFLTWLKSPPHSGLPT